MKQIIAVLILLCTFTIIGAEEMESGFKSEYIITSAESPWKGFTGNAEEEKAGKIIHTFSFSSLEGFEFGSGYTWNGGDPMLFVDRPNKRVVVNEEIFSILHRADATKATPGEKQIIGTVKAESLREEPAYLFSFLIDSQIIETYWHIEATVIYTDSFKKENIFSARFHGTHIFYTNEKNEMEFDFTIHLDSKTGEIWITG